MKKYIFLFIILLCGYFSFAQSEQQLTSIHSIATVKGNGVIANISPDYQLPASIFIDKYKTLLELQTEDEMRLLQTNQGRNNLIHYRYQHYYQDIPVEGSQWVLHEKNNLVYQLTGKVVKGLNLSTSPLISAKDALQLTLKESSGTHFAWENEGLEKDLQTIKNNPSATYFPIPELIIYDTKHSFKAENYKLVYKISLFVIEPKMYNEIIYLDAQTGKVLKKIKKNSSVNKEVPAVTRYNGIKRITVDSLAPNLYMLRSNSRGLGNGIYTKNMNNEGSIFQYSTENATDFFENDTIFDSDVVANSAHYGAEMTYDYYLYKHGRNSYDDQGTQLMSYVHMGQNMQNAFWNGSAMFYGDGVNNYPFTFLSVCGHEITHGVTQYSANLEYQNESGALNESFSDIFGVMIHYYATDTLQWTIGEELNSPFRDLSNPNRFENPDTYLGNYWVTGTEDYGGVHTNCGVGNYWFYLLTVGGSGVNDFETPYDVTGITPEKSEIIAYELLTQYLTPYSDYNEAYLYSLEVAENLYGDCSPEKRSVADAWAAVGIGYPLKDSVVYIMSILAPTTACALQNNELITLELLYNSCNDTLRSGTPLFFKVQLNQALIIYDTVFLAQDIAPGLCTLTLNKPFDFSAIGNHRIDIEVGVYNNNYTASLKNYNFTNRIYQNSDVGVAEIVAPTSSCFLTDNSPVTVKIFFDVCEEREAGSPVVVSFTINGNYKITDTIILAQAMTTEDTLLHTFSQGGNFTLKNKNLIRAFTESPDDVNATNNMCSLTVYKPKSLNQVSIITFDDSGNDEYFYTESEEFSNAYTYLLPDYDDRKVLKMTAKGDPSLYMYDLEFADDGNLWEYNKKMDSRANFCIDARGYEELALAFNLKQTSGKTLYEMLLGGDIPSGYNLLYSSMMRVLVDNEEISGTFAPSTPTNDPFTQHVIDLTPYTGDVFMLTFQSKCLAADMNLFMQNYILDNVYIDNIMLWNSVDIPTFEKKDFQFSIFPNPNQGKFTVYIESNKNRNGRLILTDITGKLILQQPCQLHEGAQWIAVNVYGLKNGIYFLQIDTGSERLVGKVVVN
jgi:Zn-dependent metalloprotease